MDNKFSVSYDGKEHTSGVASTAYWQHPRMMQMLRSLFECRKNERIVSITVNEDGITAYFETTEHNGT